MLNPVLVPMGTATGPSGPVAVTGDISLGVAGGQSNQVVQINVGWTYTTVAWGVTRPSLTGAAGYDTTGRVWSAGAMLTLLAPEAIALCASGAATFISNV